VTQGPAPKLGELEADTMSCLWASETDMTVRAVLTALNIDRQLAYTTVMTVLDNLHRKGMVTRTRDGRSYSYAPRFSQGEYAGMLMADAAGRTGDRVSALLHFVDVLNPDELRALRMALSSTEAPPPTARRTAREPS
jgi:predicted transcriptional regulator